MISEKTESRRRLTEETVKCVERRHKEGKEIYKMKR